MAVVAGGMLVAAAVLLRDGSVDPANAPTAGVAGESAAWMVSPATVDFGSMTVGQRESRTLIVTNTSDEALYVTGIEAPEGFVVKPNTLELEPGASQSLALEFAPLAAARIEAAPLIVSAVRHAPQQVAIHANVLGNAVIHVEPLSLVFGRVKSGDSAQASLRVENRGESTLALTGLAAQEPFEVGVEESELEPGESTEIQVTFNPEDAGPVESDLVIKSSDGELGTIIVALRGNGDIESPDAVIRSEQESLDFGAVPVGRSSTQYLTLSNEGSDPLTITRIAVSPPFRAPKSGWSIPAGASYRVGLQFRPQTAGAALGPVTIYSNDPDLGALVVTTVGEGTAEGGAIASAPGLDAAGTEGAPPVERVASDDDEGRLAAAAASGRPSSDALVAAERDDPADFEDPQIFANGPVVEGSAYYGTNTIPVSNHDFPTVDFNSGTQTLSFGEAQLTFELALGEVVDATLGAFDAQVESTGAITGKTMLTFCRGGACDSVPVTITTGETEISLPGKKIVRVGSNVNEQGQGELVWNADIDATSPVGGQNIGGKLAVNLPETETDS